MNTEGNGIDGFVGNIPCFLLFSTNRRNFAVPFSWPWRHSINNRLTFIFFSLHHTVWRTPPSGCLLSSSLVSQSHRLLMSLIFCLFLGLTLCFPSTPCRRCNICYSFRRCRSHGKDCRIASGTAICRHSRWIHGRYERHAHVVRTRGFESSLFCRQESGSIIKTTTTELTERSSITKIMTKSCGGTV